MPPQSGPSKGSGESAAAWRDKQRYAPRTGGPDVHADCL